MEVHLFPEVKFYSHHKPRLLPSNSRVRWVSPLLRGFRSLPQTAVPPWGVMSAAENQRRVGIVGTGRVWNQKTLPRMMEQGEVRLALSLPCSSPACFLSHILVVLALPKYIYWQRFPLQCADCTHRSPFAICMFSRNQEWSEDIIGGTWLIWRGGKAGYF